MESREHDLRKRYGRYLELCNARRFDELGEFVASDVTVCDTQVGIEKYISGLVSVVRSFENYEWRLNHTVVEGDWFAAHLTGIGTHTADFHGIAATGRDVQIQEIAMYRTTNGKITHCWGDLGSAIREELAAG